MDSGQRRANRQLTVDNCRACGASDTTASRRDAQGPGQWSSQRRPVAAMTGRRGSRRRIVVVVGAGFHATRGLDESSTRREGTEPLPYEGLCVSGEFTHTQSRLQRSGVGTVPYGRILNTADDPISAPCDGPTRPGYAQTQLWRAQLAATPFPPREHVHPAAAPSRRESSLAGRPSTPRSGGIKCAAGTFAVHCPLSTQKAAPSGGFCSAGSLTSSSCPS